jgi:hypothetical protein
MKELVLVAEGGGAVLVTGGASVACLFIQLTDLFWNYCRQIQ